MIKPLVNLFLLFIFYREEKVTPTDNKSKGCLAALSWET
jgi:hypothetical protein